MSTRRYIGDPEILKKKVPQNPKYQHIKTRLDTGNSMSKYLERIEEIKRNYRYKKDELFKRIKVPTFAQLVLQVASVSEESEADEMTNEELQRLEDSNSVLSETDAELMTDRTNGKGSPDNVPKSPIQLIDVAGAGEAVLSARSTLQSVISGVGELDLGNQPNKTTESSPSPKPLDKPYEDCPFLLLDVRDSDCYTQCHIIGAKSYPIAMLSRTMNPFIHEILDYKNSHGKIIILYDEDERIASQAATTMCERGFENVFMLSGGLKVIAQKIPEGLTTGTLPITCLPSPVQPRSARRQVTPRQPIIPAEIKWRFSSQDLQMIEKHLEKLLMSTDTSRFSRLDSKTPSSRNSQVSSSSSSRSIRSSSPHSKPWK